MQKVHIERREERLKVLEVKNDDFDESLEDIMNSINGILSNTGKGYETVETEKNKQDKK